MNTIAARFGAGAVLDLDVAHPESAVRPDLPENRPWLELVEQGYDMRCSVP